MSTLAGQSAEVTSPPSTLLAGRYRMQEVVGRGGMADVYAATDVVLGRPVAVKRLRDPLGDPELTSRFLTEATTMASFNHPGLVTVFDAGDDDDHPYLVMELIDGPTLAGHLRGRALALGEVCDIGGQLADALSAVHGSGLIHRDVKPANVLLTHRRVGGWSAHLTDFGISRVAEAAGHTRTGIVLGTAAYVSPEQARGERVTAATDIYSLGLVLLECLTGRREYDGTSLEAVLARLTRKPDVQGVDDPSMAELLDAMTSTEAAARPSAEDVRDRLAALCPTGSAATRMLPAAEMPAEDGAPTTVMPIQEGALGAPEPRRGSVSALRLRHLDRRWWWGLGVLAAALFVALVVIATSAGGPASVPGHRSPAPTVGGRLGRDLQRLSNAVNS